MKKYLCAIDSSDKDGLKGWVMDEDAPNSFVEIKVFVDGNFLCNATANIFRQDLLDAGIGNGAYGFCVAIPGEFIDNKEHIFAIGDAATNLLINGASKTSLLNKPKQPLIPVKTSIRGSLDNCDERGICGWVIDDANPQQPVDLDIFIDDELIASVTANSFRQDLFDAKIGNGNLGFSVPLPNEFWDGIEHKITIKETTSNVVLNINIQTFTIIIDYRYMDYLDKKRKEIFNTSTFNNLPNNEIIKLCYPLIDIDYVKIQIDSIDISDTDINTAIIQGLINPHPLFDNDFYRQQCKLNSIELTLFPLFHYLTIGWKIGIDPHPLFDSVYYAIDLNSMKISNIDLLSTFVLSKNESKFSPSPFVDLLHLRHIFTFEFNYKFINDAKLLTDALSMEWISIHPHIHRIVLDHIRFKDVDYEKPQSTMRDLSDLIGHIRTGQFYSSSSLQTTTTVDATIYSTSISTLILNYNKPIYTIISAFSVFNATYNLPNTECLIIDNGSEQFFVELMYRYCKNLPCVKIISLKENRFFGEGNNIGFDYCKGETILFLNNDAFINAKMLYQLTQSLATDITLGAISPVMILPNGQIQEAGGMISGCGHIAQKSKFTPFNTFLNTYRFNNVRHCDYASAAVCMLPRSTLDKVLGFDYIFEPFYFEDTDLCARIKAQGLNIAVCLSAYAVHIENVSTKEYLGSNWNSLIAQQSDKFIKRWNGIYEDLKYKEAAIISERYNTAQNYSIITDFEKHSGYSNQKVAWVYTPFDIAIGGGERYIISVAMALSQTHEVWLLTAHRYSKARLAMVMQDLNICHGKLHLAPLEVTNNWQRPNLYVIMGNEIEPSTATIGKYNIHHCQFPFPIHNSGRFACERINHFNGFLVNSFFTASNIKQAIKKYHVKDLPIHIVAPPVAIPSEIEQKNILAIKKKNILTAKKLIEPFTIVNIGRFAQGGHDKRQDVVIQIAEICKEKKLPVQFELYGGVSEAHQDHFRNLSGQANKIGVKIRGNVTRTELASALTKAIFYVHPCGLGFYPALAPERIEHFGITIVEALAYGAIPLVYKWGGPAEILNSVQIGNTFETIEEAVHLIESETNRPLSEMYVMASKAMQASRQFDEQRFYSQINELAFNLNNN